MRLEKPGDFVGERPLAGVTLTTILRKLAAAGSGAHALEACSEREVAGRLLVACDKKMHMRKSRRFSSVRRAIVRDGSREVVRLLSRTQRLLPL